MRQWEARRKKQHRVRQHLEQRRRTGKSNALVISLLLFLTLASVVSSFLSTLQTLPRAVATPLDTSQRCQADFSWPLRRVTVVQEFDAPAKPWLPGHRGIDLQSQMQDDLLAPADGVISFSGLVAGKSVVSIRHDSVISTFEPAKTNKEVGASVTKDHVFGWVEGLSDHCGKTCLHWGIKSGKKTYIDPRSKVSPSKIGLKSPSPSQ